MDWLKSKTTMVAGGCLALIGLQGYGMMSMRTTMEDRVASVERELQSMHNTDTAKLTQLSSDMDVVAKRMGITAQELQQAHALAEQLKQENAQTAQKLRRELAAKADSKAVAQFREEAESKLSEVQNEATTKIAGVTGEVQVVRTDLDATREDLANSKKDLHGLIARNSTEGQGSFGRGSGGQAAAVRRANDYRYSVLMLVFTRLVSEGWLTLEDLSGIGNEKVAVITALLSSPYCPNRTNPPVG